MCDDCLFHGFARRATQCPMEHGHEVVRFLFLSLSARFDVLRGDTVSRKRDILRRTCYCENA